MQIFFGAPAPFAYPSAPALAAAVPNHSAANGAGPPATAAAPGNSAGGYNLFGNPFSYAAQGSTAAQTPAAGHTVVNSTNALNSGAAQGAPVQNAMSMASADGGFAGGYLMPAFAAPVMVPAFIVVAVPYAVAAQQPAQAPAPVPQVQPAVDEPVAAVPEAEAPVIDVTPVPDAPEPAPVADDAPLSQSLTRLYEGRSEVSFALTLTTLEGDTVSVDFRQAASAARGTMADGNSWEQLQDGPGDEDSFTLTIDGQLNAAERGAIDALMDDVLALADDFFRGNDSAVTRGLLDLNIDGQTLSEMALSLTVSQSVEVQRGYGRDVEALDQLRRNGGDRLATLDYLASGQRMLIEQARGIFDPPSAVRFVRDSLGSLLQGAMDTLNDALADTFAVADAAVATQVPDAQQQVPSAERSTDAAAAPSRRAVQPEASRPGA